MSHTRLTRRTLLGSTLALAAPLPKQGPGGPEGSGGSRGSGGEVPSLWREFTRTPFTHPQIPYIGRAGCRTRHRGGHSPVLDVRRYGAVADGVTDSAPAINRAIAAAGRAGGGTVLIPPGTFRIDDVIRVGHSNVVVRGAGSDRTKLYATRNLTELIGVYGSRYGGDKSSWSWAGGLGTQSLPWPRAPVGTHWSPRSGRRPGPSRAGPATGVTNGGS